MKRILIMIFILAVLPSVAWAETGKAVILKDLEIPSDLEPGDEFQVSFRLENAWYSYLQEIFVYMDGGPPFLNQSPTEAQYIKILRNVDPWIISDKFTFNLSVDEDTTAGIYPLDVVVTYRRYTDEIGKSGGYNREEQVIPLQIMVDGTPEISVFVKDSEPSKVRPGDLVELTLQVVNIGTEKAKNVLIYTGTVDDVEVLWFSKAFYVGDIETWGTGDAVVQADVDDYAGPGEYILPVRVAYETPGGEAITQETSINIVVEEEADFKIIPGSNRVIAGAMENQVSFNLENTGTKGAKEVKVILKAAYPFTPTGNEYFVGRLDPGENRDISFHVDTDSDADTQRYPVDIVIQWKEDSDDYIKSKGTFIDVEYVESHDWDYLFAGVGVLVGLAILRKIVMKIAQGHKKRKESG